MNLLLDTCTLLWWVGGDRLSPAAAEAIADPTNRVWVSAATIWEISIKASIGKVTVGEDFETVVSEDFEILAITASHAWLAGRLPQHHRDPFDRMLVAQAQLQGLTLATRDVSIGRYDATLLLS